MQYLKDNLNIEKGKKFGKSCCENLDLAPIGYQPTVHGNISHRSAICGCIGSIFWVIILISILNQLNILFGDSVNFGSTLKTSQWIKINDHYVYFRVAILSQQQSQLIQITPDNQNTYGLNFTQIHSSNQQAVTLGYSSPHYYSKNVIIVPDFPLRITVSKCLIQSPQCTSICSLDPQFQYLQVQGAMGTQQFSQIFAIKDKLCQQKIQSTIGIKNQGLIDGYLYSQDHSFMSFGNSAIVKKIMGQDTTQPQTVENLKDYRPHFGEPEDQQNTILETEVKFTGLLLQQKVDQPKIDDLIPPIIGLITLFTSVFYVFSAGFKSWSLQINLINHLWPQKQQKICEPTLKQWFVYFLYTQIICLCKKKAKKIKYTERQLQKLTNQLDIISGYEKISRNKRINDEKFAKLSQILVKHTKTTSQQLDFLTQKDSEHSSSDSSQDLIQTYQQSAQQKRNDIRKSLLVQSQ